MSYKFFNLCNHRHELFSNGLMAAGYKLADNYNSLKEGDVIIVWNRKRGMNDLLTMLEARGVLPIVAENGYIGSDDNGKRTIALAFYQHHGLGKWPIIEEPFTKRQIRQNFHTSDWRAGGEEIVVLAQRNIGITSHGVSWARDMAYNIQKKTKRRVRLRLHPGIKEDVIPLEVDLEDAFAVVTYSSGAAIKAINMGVPAFYFLPGWIGVDAAKFGVEDLENPYRSCRKIFLQKISCAQWLQSEISDGTAFNALRLYYESGAIFQ